MKLGYRDYYYLGVDYVKNLLHYIEEAKRDLVNDC